ncbi:hypothetical protein ILYODFUR_016179 [Ilyodon furcidens]|uniref:C-type lectin domain-containing protein n=1 Tax=Ilyodon furcidens TaxID=33524 RepID=A0ABV0UVT4_9TELE
MDRCVLLTLLIFASFLACVHSQCREGWREYEGKCYFFSTDTKSWMEANAYCLEHNTNLMSIQNIHERLWVRTQIGTEIFWIGLNDKIVEGVWEWSDGTPFIEYLSFWMSGQPDNWNDAEDCGQLVGSNSGHWNDENCNNKRKYICKYINTNPAPQCDLASGWRQHGSNCYKFKSEMMKSWSAARHDCLQEGGDLVSITSVQENTFVMGTLSLTHLDFWIGLSTLKCNKISCQVDPGNSNFAWSDAMRLDYTNWDGEPSVDPQVGGCAALIKDTSEAYGKWRSHLCRYERPYICKRLISTICLPGWQSFNGSCYWMVSNTNLLTTWYEAVTKCSDISAHLLFINR